MIRPSFLVSLVLLGLTAVAVAPLHGAAHARPASQPPRSAAPAADKSPHELRQENERLRDRVDELEASLMEAQRRIARLEEALRTARSKPSNGSPGVQPAVEPAQPPATSQTPAADDLSGLPDDPFASPDAMLLALRKQYQQALGAMPRENDSQAQQLIREARRWVRQASLEKRKPIEWTVRVLAVATSRSPGVTNLRDSGEAVIEVLDPATGDPIGSPFTIALEAREITRLRDMPLPSKWVFGGVFAAAPSVDESRAEPGLFNVPKLIGPFVAYGYELSIRSMRPVPQEQPPAPKE